MDGTGESSSWTARHRDVALTEFVRFADNLVILREVNLESLEDPDTALCFWLNVYHTLLVHATMLFGPPLTRWKLWSELCYDIGGCPFSLLEIEHCVLRAHLSKPRHQPLARFYLPKAFARGSRREEMTHTHLYRYLETPESTSCSTPDQDHAFDLFPCFKKVNWTNN